MAPTRTKPVAAPSGSAGARRLRYLAQTAVLMVAVSAVCVFGSVLASRYAYRVDVTATREHELSDRTRRVLDGLTGDHEILITTNAAAVDPKALDQATVVLDAFARRSRHIRVSLIDVASARGVRQLDEALARLIDRYRADLDKGASGLLAAQNAARALASAGAQGDKPGPSDLDAIGAALQGVHDSIPENGDPNASALKRFLNDSATVARVGARDITEAADASQKLAAQRIGQTPIAPFDEAASALRKPVADAQRQFEQIADGLTSIANSTSKSVPEDLRQRARPLAEAAGKVRDRLARLALDIDQLPRTPLDEAARVLTQSSAALVVGPPDARGGSGEKEQLRGVVALDLATLLPPRMPELEGTVRPDRRYRAEELLASAVASLNATKAPIVCIVHAATPAGRLGPGFGLLRAMVSRLNLRGMDVVEWLAADEEQSAALNAIDPAHQRPVVYVVVPINPMSSQDNALRSNKLAAVVAGLIQSGKPVLLSLNPSNLPAIGQKDPMVDYLGAMGLRVDTAHPILHAEGVGRERAVTPDLYLMRSEPGHPVAEAVQSLRTFLTWAMPIFIEPDAESRGLRINPLLNVPADPNTWGESDWIGFRQIPANQRRFVVQPDPSSVRDDTNGPWLVAVAVERNPPAAAAGEPASAAAGSRLIVVSSNGWFFDEFTQVGAVVDNQPVPRNPGNLELLEASVYWLAHQEDLIARSADAQAAPLIPALSPTTLTTLRWALVAGLPLAVLILGALWRVVRG